MKKSIIILLLTVVLIVVGYQLLFRSEMQDGGPDVSTGRELLSISDIDLSGKSGKVTVLDFWASWCGPCRMQMPVMERFYASLADPECMQFVAVNLGESRSVVEKFLSKNNVPYKVALDGSRELADRFRVSAIPTTVILDAQGNTLEIKPGYFADMDSYLKNKIHPLAPDCVPSP